MPRAGKIVLVILLSLVALIVVAAGAFVLFVDVNRFRPQIEQAAADALGFPVAIEGEIDVDYRALRLTGTDVLIYSRGEPLATLPFVAVTVERSGLLRGAVDIREIVLREPTLSVVRNADGELNIIPPPDEPLEQPTDLRLRVEDGAFSYHDVLTGQAYEGGGVDIDLTRLRVEPPRRDGEPAAERLRLDGRAGMAWLSTPRVRIDRIELVADGGDGAFRVELIHAGVLGAESSGTLESEFRNGSAAHDLWIAVQGFEVGRLLDDTGDDVGEDQEYGVRGTLTFRADLRARGIAFDEIVATLAGRARGDGEELVLEGANLDDKLSRYESLTNFSVVDASAIFLGGPLGLAVTRMPAFLDFFDDPEAETPITAVLADWRIEDGVAHAADVALTTAENRIALQGALDFVERRFVDMKVAVIDDEGCAVLEQSIEGTFAEPDIDEPSLVEMLAEATFDLIGEAFALLADTDCEVFYHGELSHPE
jgi:hypothetical protein